MEFHTETVIKEKFMHEQDTKKLTRTVRALNNLLNSYKQPITHEAHDVYSLQYFAIKTAILLYLQLSARCPRTPGVLESFS